MSSWVVCGNVYMFIVTKLCLLLECNLTSNNKNTYNHFALLFSINYFVLQLCCYRATGCSSVELLIAHTVAAEVHSACRTAKAALHVASA